MVLVVWRGGVGEYESSYRNMTYCILYVSVLVFQQLTLIQAGEIITACEFLQICVFFLAIFYLSMKTESITNMTEGRECVVSGYSIMVRGLPHDTTTAQLITHFTNLYQLEKPDWRNRPPLAGALPLQHCDNTQTEVHVGTWIAECVVSKKIGDLLRVFKEEQELMQVGLPMAV